MLLSCQFLHQTEYFEALFSNIQIVLNLKHMFLICCFSIFAFKACLKHAYWNIFHFKRSIACFLKHVLTPYTHRFQMNSQNKNLLEPCFKILPHLLQTDRSKQFLYRVHRFEMPSCRKNVLKLGF